MIVRGPFNSRSNDCSYHSSEKMAEDVFKKMKRQERELNSPKVTAFESSNALLKEKNALLQERLNRLTTAIQQSNAKRKTASQATSPNNTINSEESRKGQLPLHHRPSVPLTKQNYSSTSIPGIILSSSSSVAQIRKPFIQAKVDSGKKQPLSDKHIDRKSKIESTTSKDGSRGRQFTRGDSLIKNRDLTPPSARDLMNDNKTRLTSEASPRSGSRRHVTPRDLNKTSFGNNPSPRIMRRDMPRDSLTGVIGIYNTRDHNYENMNSRVASRRLKASNTLSDNNSSGSSLKKEKKPINTNFRDQKSDFKLASNENTFKTHELYTFESANADVLPNLITSIPDNRKSSIVSEKLSRPEVNKSSKKPSSTKKLAPSKDKPTVYYLESNYRTGITSPKNKTTTNQNSSEEHNSKNKFAKKTIHSFVDTKYDTKPSLLENSKSSQIKSEFTSPNKTADKTLNKEESCSSLKPSIKIKDSSTPIGKKSKSKSKSKEIDPFKRMQQELPPPLFEKTERMSSTPLFSSELTEAMGESGSVAKDFDPLACLDSILNKTKSESYFDVPRVSSSEQLKSKQLTSANRGFSSVFDKSMFGASEAIEELAEKEDQEDSARIDIENTKLGSIGNMSPRLSSKVVSLFMLGRHKCSYKRQRHFKHQLRERRIHNAKR